MSTTEKNRARSQQNESERCLIGAFLRNPSLFWTHKDRLTSDLFLNDQHRAYLKIMQERADGQKTFSISSIAAVMPDSDIDQASYLRMCTADSLNPDEVADEIEVLENKLYRRRMLDIAQVITELATDRNEMSGSECYEKGRKAFENIGLSLGVNPVLHIYDYAQQLTDGINESFKAEKTIGRRLGLACFDNVMGPMFPGKAYILGGTPGAGKTALAWMIASQFGRDTKGQEADPGIFFSMEMKGKEVASRAIAPLAEIASSQIEAADLNQTEFETVLHKSRSLRESLIYLDQRPRLNWKQMRDQIYRQRNTTGCEWVIVDHLTYMGKPSNRMTPIEAVEENLFNLRALAQSLNFTLIILAQLRNEFATTSWRDIRRPTVDDFYAAKGVIFQNADGIVMLNRPEVALKGKSPEKSLKNYETEHPAYLDARTRWRNKCEFINGKLRGGEGHRVAEGWFDGKFQRFSDSDFERRAAQQDDADPLLTWQGH